MGFFDFLGGNKDPLAKVKDPRIKRALERDPKFQELSKNVKDTQGVFSFLKPGRDLAVGAGRGILKSGVSAGIDLAKKYVDPSLPDTIEVNNPIAQKVLGKEPIQSYNKRYQGLTEDFKKKGLGVAATPLAFLGTGVNAALDLTGAGGGEKKVGESLIKDLTKEVSETAVKNLAKKAGVEITDDVARSIAKTKDPNIVKNILKGESSIPKEVPIDIPPPKEIPKPPPPPKMVPNPEIAQIEDTIKTQEQLMKKAPTYTTAKKHGAVIDDLIKQRAEINASAPKVSEVPDMLPKTPVGMDIREATIPTPKAPAVSGEVIPPASADPFEDVMGAVTGRGGAAAKSAEQRALLSKERGQRFAAGAEAGKTARGSEGYFNELKAQKGEYTKVDYHPMIDNIGPQRAEDLFASTRDRILNTPDKVFEDMGLHPGGARLNSQRAVRKVLGLEPGVPTKSELKLLSVYSPKIAKEIQDSLPIGRKIFDAAATLFGNARAAKSTLDFSMGGRQGLFVAARHPVEWAKANIESIKYAKNPEYYKSEMKSIHGDDWGQLIDGHNKSVLTGGASHEEQYTSTDIVGKVPGVKGAERAYTGGLTKLRKDLITSRLQAFGATPEEVERNIGKEGIDGIIEAVSTLTGRGGKAGGFVDKHATTLQEALFSPRLWASRLQPLNPAFWKRIGPAGRKEALESLGAFAGVAGLVLGAAVAAGATVEHDPRSSDFLKIKVGDTRYDILGGFQQNLVFGARQLSGSTKSSTTGAVTKFGDKFGGPTRLSSAADLVRNKANPVLGAAANILEGKDKAGNKINPATEIGQLFVPINIQQAFNSRDNPKDVLKGLPDVVGIGSQTYGIKDTKLTDKQKAAVSKISDPKKKEAYTRLFQTAKQASGTKTNVSDAINTALEQKDLKKAQKLAKDYNDKYTKAFDSWRKQYKDYADGDLAKEYRSNMINLTPASIKSRLKTLKEKA